MKKWFRYYMIAVLVSVSILAIFAIVAMLYDSTLTPEEREQARIVQARRDSVAKIEQARRDSIETVKKLASLHTEAYLAAKEYVLTRVKFPKEADFPYTPSQSQHLGNGLYLIRGSVEAKNAFGVTSEYQWTASLRYTGGNPDITLNWTPVAISLQ